MNLNELYKEIKTVFHRGGFEINVLNHDINPPTNGYLE